MLISTESYNRLTAAAQERYAALEQAETLEAQVKAFVEQKRDGLAWIERLQTKVKHWRELYSQTQQQYVKLHTDWTTLKHRHDQKCTALNEMTNERDFLVRQQVKLQSRIAELGQPSADTLSLTPRVPGGTPLSPLLGTYNRFHQKYTPQDITAQPITVDPTNRYVVVVVDRGGTTTVRSLAKLPEGL